MADNMKSFADNMKKENYGGAAIDAAKIAAPVAGMLVAFELVKKGLTAVADTVVGGIESAIGGVLGGGAIGVGLKAAPGAISGFLSTPVIAGVTIGALLGGGLIVAAMVDILANKTITLTDAFGLVLGGALVAGLLGAGLGLLISVTIAILGPGLNDLSDVPEVTQEITDRLAEIPPTINMTDKQVSKLITGFDRLKTSGERWAEGDWFGALTTGATEAMVGLESFGSALEKYGVLDPKFGDEWQRQIDIVNAGLVTKMQMEGRGTELVSTLTKEMIDSFATYGPPTIGKWDETIGIPLSERLGESPPTAGPLAKPSFFERGANLMMMFGAGMESFADPLKGIVTSILESIVSAFNKALSNIISIVNRMITEANRASSAINSTSRGKTLPNIPKMAEGGIVTSPTLAMIGESGPEAVIPLGRGGGMGSDVYVTNHITVSPKADKEEMKKMFSTFAREQGRELRRRTSYIGGVYA